ncbi:hypothetical protein AMATHDRAFT_192297 [Amanita thiersii Skay4041]|uniref:Asteroid domain-containing protein n=1 Tax=Amanita thiersii Skay4041 TaxID=703135 RepID=A0A2A9NSX4_9AGAR|nr:hypothetical protein AMATHDRAFT_192297 [Amanita thiersii Skay4041]
MGVHGLTTFLQENKRPLSRSFDFPLASSGTVTPVVVDAWSFTYKLYSDSNLPWVYGGEYPDFYNLVTKTVQAWISIGFQVYFVFDAGPCPRLKFPTVIQRRNQTNVQNSLLFFRTSPGSRSTGLFLNETRIIPPFALNTCLDALQSLAETSPALELHFADEEGDPFAVELAGRVNGYVIGNDSDFVILNSDGYKGYIPLEEMAWFLLEPVEPSFDDDSNGEFQIVRKYKSKKKATSVSGSGNGVIPPISDTGRLKLSLVTYSPDLLAAHLRIPVALLPLLGAIVGNDYTRHTDNARRSSQTLFFERHLTLGQRIQRTAATIQNILSPDHHKKRVKHHIGSVIELIERTVNTLLARWAGTLGSGEIVAVIDEIVNDALQYGIPKYKGDLSDKENLWPTNVCSLHDPEACPLLPIISRHLEVTEAESVEGDMTQQQQIEIRGMYISAYRQGRLSGKVLDVLNTGSSWPRLFLENPDIETVGRSIGRPIRIWMYAIIADALGLPISTPPQPENGTSSNLEQNEEDDDEIIDVVESHSEDEEISYADMLAPLKGELQRLHSHQQHDKLEASGQASSVSSGTIKRPVALGVLRVDEYLRRGTRLTNESIEVPLLTDLLSSISASQFHFDDPTPLMLRPQEDALTVLLHVLKSDVPKVRILKGKQLTIALALRWILFTLQKRAVEFNNREREQERWTRREALCFLLSLSTNSSEPADTPIINRNIQIVAQVLMALDSIFTLASALLITDIIPPISSMFSGKKLHALLTGVLPLDQNGVPEHLWEACQEGLEHSFMEEKKKKSSEKAKSTEGVKSKSIDAAVAPGPRPNPFAMLAEGTA